MFIKVNLGSSVGRRSTVMVDSTRTIKSVLSENNIDYSSGTINLDGGALSTGDLNQTFDDFGIADECYLISVVKTNNA